MADERPVVNVTVNNGGMWARKGHHSVMWWLFIGWWWLPIGWMIGYGWLWGGLKRRQRHSG